MDVEIRCATARDLGFLRAMLFEAAYWRPGVARPSLDEGLARPDLVKLLAGWGRRGDHADIAHDTRGQPVGAVWCRCWTVEEHSYGFVDADTPELGIGVAPEARGRGVGARLLETSMAHAARDGVLALSLSVELDNPARRLYERLGFRPVETSDGAMTMVATTLPR